MVRPVRAFANLTSLIKSPEEYQLPSDDTIKIMNKQDKRAKIAEKIVNYQELSTVKLKISI